MSEGGAVRAAVRRHGTLAFVALTLALSWGWWAFAYAAVGAGELSMALILPGGFGPPVAAGIVTWAAGGSVRTWAGQALRWRVAPRWYLLAVALPALVAVAGVGAGLAAAGGPLDAAVVPGRLSAFLVGLVVLTLVGGGQEEFGWRGFALPRLQARYGALAASVVVGVVWAVWHLPLFLFDAARNASGSFAVYALLVVAFSVVLTWCYNETGGSVLLAMLFHGALNASGNLVPAPVDALEEWGLAVDVGWAVAALLLAAAVVVWAGADTLSRGGSPAVAGPAAPEEPEALSP